ncbi:MAG: GNAT family N-acetyltransferase [Gammaproteobacteria bacterium]|jgi:ribosomal protein S18 acetylase RimI-like enzyme|nr:GNAT family N-acetyltransferase [Gammaproteobacteria bacterium]MBT4492302.1 GNAT family N-acetyltransferase [Gammaproteobacteria bacterium]MBT7369676.1 GNAT family N-acetyltransferase [Gammaproteobacteria bacterium]
MSASVRRAISSDAEIIARFNQAMAEETENKVLPWETILTGVKTMLADDNLGFYLVACTSSDEVQGCLGITFEWSDWRNGLFWWIQSVYVNPTYRGTGIFTAMYETVKNEAQTDPTSCGIRLYVEKENERANRTYRRLGMIETDYRLMEEIF